MANSKLYIQNIIGKMEYSIESEDYVYVNNDGTYRELTIDEKAYLAQEFHPGDGARPYIKSDYKERTPDNKLHGFLLRSKLPKNAKRKNQ